MDLPEENKARRKICLPELKGVDLLRKFCLHPTKSSREKSVLHRCPDSKEVSPISTRPPTPVRILEETRGKKRRPRDVYSKFLLSHPDDRPWRRGPKDLPLWDKRETLNNKAALLTAKISSDFCEWYRSLGGSEIIDEEKIADLFAIKIPPYRPVGQKKVADGKSISGRVVSQLESRRIKHHVHLSRPRVRAPQVTPPPQELTSLTTVFEDILHLKITQGYCQIIKENPGRFRPKYLEEKQLI